MCGRYASFREDQSIADEFAVAVVADDVRLLPPSWNVAPTDGVRMVVERADRATGEITRQLRVARWGLVPSWAKDPSVGSRMINARVETVADKPAFARPFASRRALLPADGYYEWQAAAEPPPGAPRRRRPPKQPFWIHPADGDVADEDLIAREDVVVTITATGYAKRTKTDLYRSQKRGGKGVQGAGLKQDDIVNHFFVCSTHDWILFFTTQGRVYRAKAYELPEASRTARGQHVANLLAFQPEERIAQVIQLQTYEDAPYLVLATRNGLVKKSKLSDFDSNRSGGIVAVNLRDGDELVGAVLCSAEDDLLLVSAKGQSIRFSATDEALRPMGRATSGVQGMRFKEDDRLLSLNVVETDKYLLVATAGGYAKRTAIDEYTAQGRGGKGILTIQYDPKRGSLVGALIVDDETELYAITSGGGVIRTAAQQVRKAGRQTKGVRLMNLGEGDTLIAIARNAEASEESESEVDADETVESASDGDQTDAT